jgi:hypothetical protein
MPRAESKEKQANALAKKLHRVLITAGFGDYQVRSLTLKEVGKNTKKGTTKSGPIPPPDYRLVRQPDGSWKLVPVRPRRPVGGK